ncbi:hypothetical protein BC833DRAFT_612386 [Globomyces pollinis-pini]|nr:hypothetical protein BC833DRAFT_612386 [Globomyces pollinis-pini]
MSGQHTPLSSTFSLAPVNPPRVSVEVTINSDYPGINTFLVEFFTGAKMFAKILRKDDRITTAVIQGHPDHFTRTLHHLKDLLYRNYDAAIVWGEVVDVAEENKYDSITIEDTAPTLKRDPSSGEFLERKLDEISFGGSAATENFNKILQKALADAAMAIGVTKGVIQPIPKEHISFKYKDQRYSLEVSSIRSLEALIQAVSEKVQIPQPIKLLYTIEDNDTIIVTDVKDLREGRLYYALTVNEELPKKQTGNFSVEMERFFDKLKMEEGKSDEQVKKVRDVFYEQDIEFKQLMATGDLAMTDAKLEKYGITQGGLRTAILSVIKSNV